MRAALPSMLSCPCSSLGLSCELSVESSCMISTVAERGSKVGWLCGTANVENNRDCCCWWRSSRLLDALSMLGLAGKEEKQGGNVIVFVESLLLHLCIPALGENNGTMLPFAAMTITG